MQRPFMTSSPLSLAVPSPASQGSVRAAATLRSAVAALPGAGSAPALLRLLGSPVSSGADDDTGLRTAVMRVQRDAVLLHEGAQGHTLYVVRSGSFKCVRTLEDGYEQVLSLALPGELLGHEALHGGTRHCSAVALEDATVYALPRAELNDLRQRSPALEQGLRYALSRQLSRAVETAEMMSAVASDARLARFILWLSARMAEMGQSPLRLRLQMGRRDIASLLGLAHETVSRSFTLLSEQHCWRVDNREIEILDMQALRERARNTRGPQAECTPRKVETTASSTRRQTEGPLMALKRAQRRDAHASEHWPASLR
jgi:CRP/FNR family transcriptional regulator, anaerobic regulatory protein